MRSWHVTWSSDGRHPLFPSEGSRRRAVRALARVAGHSIALFCLVDDHVHVVLWCDDARVRRLCRSIGMALAPIAAVELDRPFSRPVRDRGHMDWLADTYILRQPWKHGLCQVEHPALWSGSCFSDLVGARALDGLSLRIGDALPRFVLRRAYRAVFLPQAPIVPASDDVVRAIGAARLVRAAAAAVAAPPDLSGNEGTVVLARRAAAVVASECGLANAEMAFALHMGPIASSRLRTRPVPPPVKRAVRLQLALEMAVAAAVPPPPPPPPTASEPDGPAYGDADRKRVSGRPTSAASKGA